MRTSTLVLSALLHGAVVTGAALVVHGREQWQPELPDLGIQPSEAQAPAAVPPPPPEAVVPESWRDPRPRLAEPPPEPFDPNSFEVAPAEPVDLRRLREPVRPDLSARIVPEPEPAKDEVVEPEPVEDRVAEFLPDVEARVLDDNEGPLYPLRARQLGLEGEVWVAVTVDPDGRARSVTLQKASRHAVLNRAALKAVKNWRFRPARRGGKTVESVIVVPVEFRLHAVGR